MSRSRHSRLAIFPLPGAILFPRSQLPLHIFEPRYRDMVRDALDGSGRIGMIQPQGIEEDAPLYPVGCIGEIVNVEELEDGPFQHCAPWLQSLPHDRRDRHGNGLSEMPKSTWRASTTTSRSRCR